MAASLSEPAVLTITSSSAPSLNGTYACDALRLSAMQQEVNAILLAGATPAFADGSQAVNWPDTGGAGHSFNPAQFHELAVAVGNYVVQRLQYMIGLTTTQPPNTATIA